MWLGFPQKMRDELINRGVETRPSGGWDYPKPVPVLMEEGGKPPPLYYFCPPSL